MNYLITAIILTLSGVLSIIRLRLQQQTEKADYWRQTAILLQTQINNGSKK
jgi:hypothetical protein